MEAGGGWQGGPRGAGQGQAGGHLAGGHGPYVRDVPPLVISQRWLVVLSSIIGHRVVFSVFWAGRKCRIVAGVGGGGVGSYQSCASGSYQSGSM